MTLAIAHREGDVGVRDVVLERRPPFSPDAVLQEFCTVLRATACARSRATPGSGPRERFDQHGVEYRVSERTDPGGHDGPIGVFTMGRNPQLARWDD